MPDNADIGGQSTPPLVNVADGRAVVRHASTTGSNPPTSRFCARPSIASMRTRRFASWC
jgi:hypothetical protein